MNGKSIVSIMVGGLVICGVAGFLSTTTVPANSVGIKYSKFTGTSEETLPEGVHFKIPFVERVEIIDTKVQERTDKEVSVQTKDAQWVNMVVNVKYAVSPENAFKVYKRYGTLDALKKNIVGNYAQEALNQVCSGYNVIDILGADRNEIMAETTKVLSDKFEQEGITLHAITVKDMDAGETIEKAIANEAVAKKEAETAIQAQEKAKAEAETKKINAEAAAEVKRIEAQAQADANKALSESITQELIDMKEAEARLKHGWVTVQGADATVVKE